MAYRADDPAPLLPASLRSGLQGGLWKLLGFLMLAACAALSVSLLSWSASDPSLMRVTSGSARNLLGPPGAILSDMLMQMLGLAGVFVLLPPLFWALRLLTAEPPTRLGGRLVLAPVAVLFLAAAASSLPLAAAWPLHHRGYGGVMGDLGLGLLASLLAHVNPDRSAAAAGLFSFAAGLTLLMSSLGLSRRDLRLICHADARPGLEAGLRGLACLWREASGLVASFKPTQAPQHHQAPPAQLREPPRLHLDRPPQLAAAEPEPELAEPMEALAVDDAPLSPARDLRFDRDTDDSSVEIAKRFAPVGIDPAGHQAASQGERAE
ncbi:MAG TPA: DNA translocase FtsK 4TM domain-containing protein, partial [Hyphomicrobiaceae bacterium]|nr:DNA translocase FtsK 4TM domain-containing protein [Hyphomicrobiaceae bacterium]